MFPAGPGTGATVETPEWFAAAAAIPPAPADRRSFSERRGPGRRPASGTAGLSPGHQPRHGQGSHTNQSPPAADRPPKRSAGQEPAPPGPRPRTRYTAGVAGHSEPFGAA